LARWCCIYSMPLVRGCKAVDGCARREGHCGGALVLTRKHPAGLAATESLTRNGSHGGRGRGPRHNVGSGTCWWA